MVPHAEHEEANNTYSSMCMRKLRKFSQFATNAKAVKCQITFFTSGCKNICVIRVWRTETILVILRTVTEQRVLTMETM